MKREEKKKEKSKKNNQTKFIQKREKGSKKLEGRKILNTTLK